MTFCSTKGKVMLLEMRNIRFCYELTHQLEMKREKTGLSVLVNNDS